MNKRLVAFALGVAVLAGCPSGKRHPDATPLVGFREDVVYTPLIEQGGPGLVDIFEPPAPLLSGTAIPTDRPALVLIHGGSWSSGSKRDVRDSARSFAERGFVVFAPDFSQAPAVQWPAPLLDLQQLMGYVRTNATALGVDSSRVGAVGVDSGGHLATMLALVDDARVPGIPPAGTRSGGRAACAVAMGSPHDLEIQGGLGIQEQLILKDFLGENADRTPARLREASTTTYVRPDASVMAIHGARDLVVSPRNSVRLVRALELTGGRTELVLIADGRHDLSTYNESRAATLQFLKAELRIPN